MHSYRIFYEIHYSLFIIIVLEIELQGEQLILDSEKAIYWVRHKALLLADLHLGKAEHFRREGLPVPMAIRTKNLNRIDALLKKYKPERVLFLGDLFHSLHNHSWTIFCDFLKQRDHISFELVIGNHDILTEADYQEAGLILNEEPYLQAPFILSHHPQEEILEGYYNLYGHIHPCVYLEGLGKQYMRVPCFHFGEYHGVLPAFGEFTGMAKMNTQDGDRVYIAVEDIVKEVFF